MPILIAQIPTERASRYLTQFCKHADAMASEVHRPRMHLHGVLARRDVGVSADWTETRGTVTFSPWGRCTLDATADTLALRIDATDDDGLDRIRDIVTRDLQRFSSRAPLTVTWQPSHTAGSVTDSATAAVTSRRSVRRPTLHTVLLALAAILVVGVHVGLVGTLAANSAWTGIAGNLVVAAIAVKLALIGWARYRTRRRTAAKIPDHQGDDNPSVAHR
jgi:hypothetical protein